MDRETAIIVAATTIVLTLIGSWYLSPRTPAATGATSTQAQFSAEDVRYKFQLEEEKRAKKRKGAKPPAPSGPEAPSQASENEAPTNDESAGDESVGDESAEAPPIE
jgi:hypothetical protein